MQSLSSELIGKINSLNEELNALGFELTVQVKKADEDVINSTRLKTGNHRIGAAVSKNWKEANLLAAAKGIGAREARALIKKCKDEGKPHPLQAKSRRRRRAGAVAYWKEVHKIQRDRQIPVSEARKLYAA